MKDVQTLSRSSLYSGALANWRFNKEKGGIFGFNAHGKEFYIGAFPAF
jgi:hypothetical protein